MGNVRRKKRDAGGSAGKGVRASAKGKRVQSQGKKVSVPVTGALKNSEHCSLFPTASVIEEFRHELAGFTISKGTVQFPMDKALPTALIKKLVKARVAQCERAQRS